MQIFPVDGDHLPAGEMQRAMRAISYIVFIKILLIDKWNNLPADRVEATDVTIDNCSEESCYAQFRFLKLDLRPLFIALRFPAQIRLDNNSVVPGVKSFFISRPLGSLLQGLTSSLPMITKRS